MVKLVVGAWLVLIAFGMNRLHEFSKKPGEIGKAHAKWPQASRIVLNKNARHLVMFIHPGCSCSKASLTNFNQILGLHPELEARVVFLSVPGIQIDGSHPLMKLARERPQTQIIYDHDGFESNQFNAKTSGIAFLYNNRSQLLFTGGLTQSRGHYGESHGMRQVLGHLKGESDKSRLGHIFGCSLFGTKIASTERGNE